MVAGSPRVCATQYMQIQHHSQDLQQPPGASLHAIPLTPAACPKTTESALPDADLFHQPVPSPLLGKQPLSVIGFLTVKDLTPTSP